MQVSFAKAWISKSKGLEEEGKREFIDPEYVLRRQEMTFPLSMMKRATHAPTGYHTLYICTTSTPILQDNIIHFFIDEETEALELSCFPQLPSLPNVWLWPAVDNGQATS